MSERPDSEPLARSLGLWGIFALVINGLIGAGIFGIPAEAAQLTGSYSTAMFVFCALLILPITLCFAELSSYFRGTGGPMRYAAEGFGSFAGFQTGWMVYLARTTSFAANLNLLVDSAAAVWAPANQGATRIVLIALVAGGFTWVNVIGTDWAIRVLSGLTVLKLLPLIGLVAIGISYASPLPVPSEALPSLSNFGDAALLTIYAYVGFTSALIPAGEAHEPARDMPRALLLGLAVATTLYVLIQSVCLGALPNLRGSDSPLIDVAGALVGPIGALILAAVILASVGGNLLGSSLSAPRLTYAMARDGHLPKWFGAVHPGFKTPHLSVICYGALAFAMASMGSFVWLAKMGVLVRLLFYILCIAAIPRLRPRFSQLGRKFVPWGGYLVPATAILVSAWLLLQVKLDSWLVTGAGLAIGTILFLVASRQSAARRSP